MRDEYSEKLNEYRAQINECSGGECEGVFQRVADSYEDDLLEFDEFPDNYFEFVIEQLSTKNAYSKPGLWNFLMVLSTEQGKLLPDHYRALAECFIKNFSSYDNSDLCLAVCDFVARNYPIVEARVILGKLGEIENTKPEPLRGFVNEGLIIVAAEEKRASDTSSRH